ncbi:Alpha/Beta hydrolase protein [Vararia minispora EC-137]|uniref:Alpha/Beta hydrolase protein n=1 Tax=Vararia minispora EC-137 TaxID=1314806 RepID=A0ACB8QC38_9AGAM|nr:Alpha/Beta hydrolase protein [Vararia minispora EC-137]
MKAVALAAFALLAHFSSVQAVPAVIPRATAPSIKLDNGTFVGATSGNVNKWLGIPFAKPPLGDLRFNLPQPNDPYSGTYTVTSFGKSCPQQAISLPIVSGLAQEAIDFIANSIFGLVFPDDEDCLTVNVFTPTGVTSTSKLPVVAWIFGGGFELGSPAMYDGSKIVSRSIQIGQPVVYVSMNYRVSAFGFLASKEVKAAGVGNLGLRDQREALRWIQKYITSFGGDPTKVTIWGESAGAISVAMQMLTNGGNTEGLFRAGFMESGSPIPVGDITNGQPYYDDLVKRTGCTGASDTLQCLRSVDYSTLKNAMDQSPGIFAYQQSLVLAWLPRADGDFLPDAPQKLVEQGSVANIPFITGDCDDEGTLFSLSTLNITTDAQLQKYINDYFLPKASAADVAKILGAYPADITQGSPFGTSVLNSITPQFKRIAAMQGDLVFNAPRRFFLQQRSGKQNTWSFLSKRLKALPVLGSTHFTDILNVYGGGEMADYLIRFAVNLDPNGGNLLTWPKYTTASPNLMTFQDGLFEAPLTITQDTFRTQGFNVLTNLSLAYPI